MSPRSRAAKRPEPISESQAELWRLADAYRHASKLLRGLTTTLQGHRINDTSARAHAETMRRARDRLKHLGHDDIGKDLDLWHGELAHAQHATDDSARRCRRRARALTVWINVRIGRSG